MIKKGDIVYTIFFNTNTNTDIAYINKQKVLRYGDRNYYCYGKVLKTYYKSPKCAGDHFIVFDTSFTSLSALTKFLIKRIFSENEDKINLLEALEIKKIKYSGTRKNYKIHDPNPNVLIIDKDYNVDGHGESVLGINLNYLDKLSKADKKNLIRDVNKLDNSILKISGIKAWLRSIFSIGDYDLSTDEKIKRYKELIKKFPILKKVIRRYKYDGISTK